MAALRPKPPLGTGVTMNDLQDNVVSIESLLLAAFDAHEDLHGMVVSFGTVATRG